ncbi:MAG: PfkB family carbohydrate kinase [Acidimicrobiales bacterium]
MGLVVLDSVLVDLTLRVAELPERGGDVRSSWSSLSTGGGFNVLAAASRQGLDARYGGRLGHGPFAELARASLEAEGIAHGPLEGDDDLGVCVVVVDAAGERTFITAPGAELGLRASSLAELDLESGDYLYLSGYNLAHPELAAVIAPWVRTIPEGVVVAFDPGARFSDAEPTVLDDVLERTDWLLASASECRALASEAELEVATRALLERIRAGVVVHDGPAGCLIGADGEVTRVAGYDVTIVDTNGAGDAHNGVFLAGLASGFEARDAARRANAAAAIAIESFGPAQAPTRARLDSWLEARS